MSDLKLALAGYPQMQPMEMLAIVSQLVGNMIALQDQTKYCVTAVMAVVNENMLIGNKVAVDTFLGQPVGNA